MIKEVFLLWHAYVSKELLLIGTLRREDKGYSFEYGNDAIKAMSLGCFLPFPYTIEKYCVCNSSIATFRSYIVFLIKFFESFLLFFAIIFAHSKAEQDKETKLKSFDIVISFVTFSDITAGNPLA